VSSRRLLKAAEAVREVVSMAILTQVRDPRVRDVTVTQVEMDADMRGAPVHVSVMGSPAKEELALRGLASSAGFLQSLVAERIDTRYTPKLRFKLDGGVKKSIEIARMLREVLPAGDDVPAGPAEEPGDDHERTAAGNGSAGPDAGPAAERGHGETSQKNQEHA
jgi:ribosome-binding factor A